MSATVLVLGGRCLDCGLVLEGVNWYGDESDRRAFPITLPAEEVREASAEGCGRCGGQVLLEVEAVVGGAQ